MSNIVKNPIYEPKGKAKEYGDLALNIYSGCPHRCFYCYVPIMLRKDKEDFHSHVEPRAGIVEAVRRQLEKQNIAGKTIHLCFTCDPYPTGYDSTPTREIIKLIKDSGNHVQILTKGNGSRDFDLLDKDDRFGVTITGGESEKKRYDLSEQLIQAKANGISTWISFEPVIDADNVLEYLRNDAKAIDKVKIGKLNYYWSDIDWRAFGIEAEEICKAQGIDYYIKESLKSAMQPPPKIIEFLDGVLDTETGVFFPYRSSRLSSKVETEEITHIGKES